MLAFAACGGTPREPVRASATPIATTVDAAPEVREPDPDLHRPPPQKLLSIEWQSVKLDTDADARALWRQIAPTGQDWDSKIEELPDDVISQKLAVALLREGNFRCMPPAPTGDCSRAPLDVDPPAASATIDDPCLRRLLALWAIEQLEDSDLPAVRDALKSIAALPPPESQLVASAIRAIPESDPDGRYELVGIAWKAGQTQLVGSMLNVLDEPHLVQAATKLHIDGALEALAAESHRAVFIAAVLDEKMLSTARVQAISELVALDDKLAPDVRTALAIAAKSPDCAVAALAARTFAVRGDMRFVPKRGTTKPMRAMCVLASYEQLQHNDELSQLTAFVPARGLELSKVTYDAYSDTDTDGDGDPHTERTIALVPKSEVVLPEIEDLARAMKHCTGNVCKSDEHEFRFTWKDGFLARLEVIERPPCSAPRAVAP